jgi:NAD(P)-dependent dehydrogenase (short-subunit alcohol dehydrogenase family)
MSTDREGTLPLAQRVLVVIGGTTGLGLAGARAVAAAGARVVVVGRKPPDVDRAVAELGSGARGLAGDAGQPDTADRAIDLARREFGRFDGLYHVAGGSGRRFGDGPLHELTDQGIQQTLQLNLTSLIYSNRAAARALLGSGGAVLNMASVLGYAPAPRYFATHVYAAAKAAVLGLTRAAAAYYAPHNVRFNALAPALVDTPMARRAAQDAEIQRYIATKQPLDGGRIGRPEDLDAAVVLLLSDQSRFVTGQCLAVDGGWSISEGQLHDS